MGDNHRMVRTLIAPSILHVIPLSFSLRDFKLRYGSGIEALRCLLRSPVLWQPSGRMDAKLVEQGIVAIDQLARMPQVSEQERAAIREALSVCRRVIDGQFTITTNANDQETAAKELATSVLTLAPGELFKWLDKELLVRARSELQVVMRAWVADQVGKHGFEDLPIETALAKKHFIARGIQERLDQIGLVIRCEHVQRSSTQPCGNIGRLNALKKGTAVSGQYLVTHRNSSGQVDSHMAKKLFPFLKLEAVETS